MENPKSLLELLKDEDKLKYDVRFDRETYEILKSEEETKKFAYKYKEHQEKAEQELLYCRKEIIRYLKFLETLIDD